MQLLLLPLMGPFHLRYPRYNAVSLRELLAASQPEALATSALTPGAFASPQWQDTAEIALPLAVVPWAKRQRLPVFAALEPSPDPQAQADFRRYASQYPQLRAAWQQTDALLRPLNELLEQPLDLPRISSEVLPLLREHQEQREVAFEDGPATDWLRARCEATAARILSLPHERVALLASAEHIPFLQRALSARVDWLEPPQPPQSPAARERALLDFAFRGEVADPASLLAQLRELAQPEARFHEANLLLAHHHAAEALEVLERASREDFSQPYFLPGYLLSRLGQLYDLAGQRDAARRAYRGVLALDYAPAEAREAARAGLEAPFSLPEAEAE